MAKEAQLVTPLEKLETLPAFEGSQVLGVGIEIPGAGGGLRESLTIEPVVFHKGDVVHVVLKCEVSKLRFDPVKDTDAVRRIHIMEVKDAAIVDAEDVADMLEAQAERIEEARGIARLDFDGEQRRAELEAEHDEGGHADETVDGCPPCDLELELAASEAVEDQERADELKAKRTEGGGDGGD